MESEDLHTESNIDTDGTSHCIVSKDCLNMIQKDNGNKMLLLIMSQMMILALGIEEIRSLLSAIPRLASSQPASKKK